MLARVEKSKVEGSKEVRHRVQKARERQIARQGKCNASLSVPELDALCVITREAQQLLNQVMNRFHFSARVYHRIIKLAQTIADLEESNTLSEKHIGEALQYRSLDRMK